MDAFISEAQIISCDELDELNTELILPGHRTICSARVNLEINHKRNHSRCVRAKLDSCGSVSIAHSNLMNEIKPAGEYNLPSIRLRGIGGKTNLLLPWRVLHSTRGYCGSPGTVGTAAGYCTVLWVLWVLHSTCSTRGYCRVLWVLWVLQELK